MVGVTVMWEAVKEAVTLVHVLMEGDTEGEIDGVKSGEGENNTGVGVGEGEPEVETDSDPD